MKRHSATRPGWEATSGEALIEPRRRVRRERLRIVAAACAAVALSLVVAACSRADRGDSDAASTPGQGPAAELRLGYFPNITHAPALIGVDKGFFTAQLGGTRLVTQQFNAGPAEVNALLGGSLDAGFMGSSPAINAFAKSDGEAIRLIAGSTSGGAQLVVRPGITTPEQLKGTTIATPQLGNTQDVALKKWLKEQNLPTGSAGVRVQNLDNPRTLDLFRTGQVDGGWLPEPWSSQLVDAGAKELVDERTLWPGGQFPTTVLVVRTAYLKQHPETVAALLRGTQQAVDFATANPSEAKAVTNEAIKRLTNAALPPAVLDRAFSELSFGLDPLAGTFPQLSKDSVTAGAAPTETRLDGFVDVTELNKVLRAAGKPAVDAAGLDKAQR